jgi:hypothetical protein
VYFQAIWLIVLRRFPTCLSREDSMLRKGHLILEPSKTVNPLNWRPGCFPWNLKKNIARRKGRKEQPGQPVLRTSRV